MNPADHVAVASKAAEALTAYVGTRNPVPLPELVHTIAVTADTSPAVAKQAIFRAIDLGQAQFTVNFAVQFNHTS
ncbi:hypothetical protein [Cellulomonas cellasea]|uniref:Uncharacterized protein n=1 Tax=Cellulomonas cellasea TaxID=43670 RepID=A0A7W4UHS0_9CELL|nr:hypothetical protein [Cellulomonas cellasea]MBB2924402.1 hypothetical protein [Cellulomonas cellasea]